MFATLVLALSFVQVAANPGPTQSRPVSPPIAIAPKLAASEVAQLQSKAEADDAAAQLSLGRAYQDGNGVKQDDETAVKWYRKAAEQGNATAQNDLGIMYRTGSGVEKSKEEAVSWYRKSARQGNASAMFNLGAAYYNGDGVGENIFTAYDWFVLGKEAGNAQAADAVQRTAAEIGERACNDAQLEVARMYEKGVDVPRDYEQAAKSYRIGADRKDPRAMVELAAAFMNGRGVPQDYAQTMELCRKAAETYPQGQYCVGVLYQHGVGVKKDDAEAAKWYTKAAAANHPAAMFELGQMCWKGQGVKTDRPEAYFWFFRAYQLGDASAKPRADVLSKEMSRDDFKQLEKKLRQRHYDPKKVFEMMGMSPTS
jgi:TPR repeat protein